MCVKYILCLDLDVSILTLKSLFCDFRLTFSVGNLSRHARSLLVLF